MKTAFLNCLEFSGILVETQPACKQPKPLMALSKVKRMKITVAPVKTKTSIISILTAQQWPTSLMIRFLRCSTRVQGKTKSTQVDSAVIKLGPRQLGPRAKTRP